MAKPYSSTDVDKLVDQVLSPMSNAELSDLIAMDKPNLDTRLDEIIKDLSIIKKLDQEKELLITKNKSLAEINLEKQPRYTELREQLTAAHQEALELQKKIQEKQNKLSANTKGVGQPDVLRGLLQVAAQEAEEKSEMLASQFTSGEKTYEQFLEEFVKLRTLSHARRIKYEKLIEHIQQIPASISTHNPYPPPLTAPSHPYSAPFAYPYGGGTPAHGPVRSAPLPPYMNSGPNAFPPYSIYSGQPAPPPSGPSYPFNYQ